MSADPKIVDLTFSLCFDDACPAPDAKRLNPIEVFGNCVVFLPMTGS